MKNIKHIISNLSKMPNLNRLKNTTIIDKLIETLPYNLRRAYLFHVIKNNRLLIALSHPSYANEVNFYKKNIILEHIKIIQDMYKDFDELQNIRDVLAYVPKDVLKKFNDDIKDIIVETYTEQANGNFVLSGSNKFINQFSAIKSIIVESSKYN